MRRTSTDRGNVKGFEQPNPIRPQGQLLIRIKSFQNGKSLLSFTDTTATNLAGCDNLTWFPTIELTHQNWPSQAKAEK